ncbi:unnamed protein product, partial [Brassica oleracea]
MTVGRNGALSTAVRCPRGESACGDHIVFGLLFFTETPPELLFFTEKPPELLFFIDLPLNAEACLLHRSTTACRDFSSSPSYHRILELLFFTEKPPHTGASLLHRETTGASILNRATTRSTPLHRATTVASLLHRDNTRASLLHPATTGASLLQPATTLLFFTFRLPPLL